MGLALKTLTRWEMGWLLIFLGIVLVPNLRADDSVCRKLPSWSVGGNDPIKKAVGEAKVSVVMFVKAGCPSSRRQVKYLKNWFEGLDKGKRSQSTLSFVNKKGQTEETDQLTKIIKTEYSVYQDTDELSIWESWKGMKDCIYVIDHCGNKIKKIHRWNKQEVENNFDEALEKREENDECEDCDN